MIKEISNIINAIKHEIDAMCKTNDMYEFACLRADIIDNINKLAHKKRECIEADDPAHGSWIPVSERLPEEETDVLVCNRNGDIEISRGSYSTEVENDFIWYTSGWRFGKIIAWMPMPLPPYKTESEEEE